MTPQDAFEKGHDPEDCQKGGRKFSPFLNGALLRNILFFAVVVICVEFYDVRIQYPTTQKDQR